MKKNFRIVIYLMIAVTAAAGIFLWSQGKDSREILQRLDPESCDVKATCIGIEGNHLICNAGSDMYLFLDGVNVYLGEHKVKIRENGDEIVRESYSTFSVEDLQKEIAARKEVPVCLWLTENGKVKEIMAFRETFENRNASLAALDGLDPNTSTATSVILSAGPKGLKVAPGGYTEETADKFKDLITEYRFAKNVKFYRGTVTITVDADGKRSRNIQYAKDSFGALKRRLGQGITAHLWVNDRGRVYAVLTHEEKVILE